MADQWADVVVGSEWVSRDRRDCGLRVTVTGITEDRIQIQRFRRSYVRKDRWHREYAPAATGRYRTFDTTPEET